MFDVRYIANLIFPLSLEICSNREASFRILDIGFSDDAAPYRKLEF